MTNGLVQHITVEESTSILGLRTVGCDFALFADTYMSRYFRIFTVYYFELLFDLFGVHLLYFLNFVLRVNSMMHLYIELIDFLKMLQILEKGGFLLCLLS